MVWFSEREEIRRRQAAAQILAVWALLLVIWLDSLPGAVGCELVEEGVRLDRPEAWEQVSPRRAGYSACEASARGNGLPFPACTSCSGEGASQIEDGLYRNLPATGLYRL